MKISYENKCVNWINTVYKLCKVSTDEVWLTEPLPPPEHLSEFILYFYFLAEHKTNVYSADSIKKKKEIKLIPVKNNGLQRSGCCTSLTTCEDL